MAKFVRALIVWCYGLIGGCLYGLANATLLQLGMVGAKALGVDVPTLNWNALKVAWLIGVLTHGAAYIQKAPLPALEFDDTDDDK
jgi:hypothetical protein